MATNPIPSLPITQPTHTISHPIQFSHQIHTSLNQDNFLLWKSQVVPVLRGHGLLGFLDGSRLAPPPHLTTTQGVSQPNPAFESWIQQDQLILAWIFSSISPSVLNQVVRCETSAQVWSTLNQFYSSQSIAKTLDLKLQLQTTKKGGNTCSQYLQQMQNLVDRLRSIGVEVSDQEFLLYIVQGLGSDFESFVTAISVRNPPPSITEFSSLLLIQEARILTTLRSTSSTAVHLTTATGNFEPNPSDTSVNYANFKSQTGNYKGKQNQGRGRGGYRGRGRGRPGNYTQESVICQICSRSGHSALDCYHRFDIRYIGPSSDSSSHISNSPHQALVAEPNSSQQNKQDYYIDSGASTHVTSDFNALSNPQPYHGPDAVHIGNGAGLNIAHKGSSILYTSFRPLVLTKLLHVPDIKKNLLSVSQLILDNNVIVEFSHDSCFVKDQATKQVLLHGILHRGLYKIIQASQEPKLQVLHISQSTTDVWHYRLAHCSSSVQDKLIRDKLITVKHSSSFKSSLCNDCNMAKSHKLPFTNSINKATKPLEVVHTDLWGPSPVASVQGHRYYIHFIDEFSRFSWLYPCVCKSDVKTIFAQFKVKVENLLSCSIKTLQCDGGAEFKPLMTQYPEISFQLSCPYTQEQNGMAERKHRHVVELGLANLIHADIPLKFWDTIFQSVTFVINRLPSPTTGDISPFEKLFNQKPDYNLLHTLGCACYPLLRPYTKHKLEPRSAQCIFLGYSTIYKGYFCLQPETARIYISRNVNFDENVFPFKVCKSSPTTTSPNQPISSTLTIVPLDESILPTPTPSSSNSSNTPETPPIVQEQSDTSSSSLQHEAPQNNSHHMVTRTQTRSLKPKSFPDHHVYSAENQNSSQLKEPTCYTQAVKLPVWRQAMATELTALANNSTWDLVEAPTGAHIIGAKWIFKTKLRADGTLERHKARLVAKGYSQLEGIDYEETFSPVIKPATIRIVLTIALSQNWHLQQLDVNNAFLHGDLQETVYMEQPPGFTDQNHPSYVCKLKKALYGLKQAPRAWFSKLKHFLLSHQFKGSQADNSLFIYSSGNIVIYLLVYVDDILLTGNNSQAIQAILDKLHSTFSIKNLGKPHYFLGIEVGEEGTSLHLSQTRYLTKILERAKMETVKPCHTPMQAGQQLSKLDGTKMANPQLYRSIVGALQYATITRPDLAFAVNKASQYMSEPRDTHWQFVKRILRYLKGTLFHGLNIQKASHLSLHAYCDADWAGCPDDRRSTTGFAIYLGPNLVSWSAKKQPTVARSSTEAEYRSLAVTASELTWISSLLTELKYPVCSIPTMWCDNLGATFLASNPACQARSKHIELDYHFVREKVENKQILVKFICSADQIADFFTKGLSKPRFVQLRNKLHVFPNQSRLRGAVREGNADELDDSSIDSNGEENTEDAQS
jgi:Reverse transcriptase (RNA-dependent DNA polymerase)/gag-polypeptide of LTR copia-type/GAG-pre-integrase domain